MKYESTNTDDFLTALQVGQCPEGLLIELQRNKIDAADVQSYVAK